MFLCSHPLCDFYRILCLEVERRLCWAGRCGLLQRVGVASIPYPLFIIKLYHNQWLLINLPNHRRRGGARGNLMSFSFLEGKFLIYWLLSDLLSTRTFFYAWYFRSVFDPMICLVQENVFHTLLLPNLSFILKVITQIGLRPRPSTPRTHHHLRCTEEIVLKRAYSR